MKRKITAFFCVLALLFTLSIQNFARAEAYGGSAAMAQSAAETLYSLGLMRGVGTGTDGKVSFEIYRRMTREEAIAMLIRLLGEESIALKSYYSLPFSDVSDWAKPYVSYAYAKGYTLGMGGGVFGGAYYVSASEYLTFVLRALGYESGTDFNWDSAFVFSDLLGLTKGEYGSDFDFLRGDAAIISLGALAQTEKHGSVTLLTALCQRGAVSYSAVSAAGLNSLLGEKVLSSGEVYAKSRESVFEITAYGSDGNVLRRGLGFFIDGATLDISLDADGLAVTNFSVLKGAYSARIRCFDGREFDVLGSYAYSEASDLMLIKVDGKGFDYLKIENSRALTAGDALFSAGLSSASGSMFSGHGGLGFSCILLEGEKFTPGAPVLNVYGELVGAASGKGGYAAPTAGTLRYLTYTGFRSFSRLIGYGGVVDAPDFGAYFGFTPLMAVSDAEISAYYYDEALLRAAFPNAFEDYETLIKNQGFVYTGELDTKDFFRVYYSKGETKLSLSLEAFGGKAYFVVRTVYALS